MCSSAKHIFIYANNSYVKPLFSFMIVFNVTKVSFLIMNLLFHWASSAIFLPLLLTNNKPGVDVLT